MFFKPISEFWNALLMSFESLKLEILLVLSHKLSRVVFQGSGLFSIALKQVDTEKFIFMVLGYGSKNLVLPCFALML